MWVTRPSQSVAFCHCATPLSTALSPTGMTWRRSGTTPSTTSCVSRQRCVRVCVCVCLGGGLLVQLLVQVLLYEAGGHAGQLLVQVPSAQL
jgi:hypothetical protein